MILETAVDRLLFPLEPQEFGVFGFDWPHLFGDNATRPIARLAGRLAALLVVAGAAPASSSRLASRPASRTLGRVQPRFPG